MSTEKKTGLELMRTDFPEHQISQKPQGTKSQNDCPDSEKVNCKICGGWHHRNTRHLSYVGHAALTDRLLDADIGWSWEPLVLRDGLPAFDAIGGLWIKLTVGGVMRLGYGNAAASQYKEVGSREKEVIGDALRNAAMRFGAALDLWHKGDLHIDEPEPARAPAPEPKASSLPPLAPPAVSTGPSYITGMITKVGKKKSQLGKIFFEVCALTDSGLVSSTTESEALATEAKEAVNKPGCIVMVDRDGDRVEFLGVAPF